MNHLTTIPVHVARRRRFRRRLSLAALAVVLLLAVAYATLPLWLPTKWLARSLADQLSASLDRPVRIGAIRAGWITGLVLEDLAIAERPGFPNALSVRAGRVRCELAPLTMFLKGKVKRIELQDPELWLVFDEHGGLMNLDDLVGDRPGRLPSLRYAVRDAACHVLTPRTNQTFKIDQLDCQLEPKTGTLRLLGQAMITRAGGTGRSPLESRMSLDASVHVPKLKRDEQLDGDILVQWDNLTLNDLPWPLVVRIPIEQVDGTTTGQLKLAAHADLGIDYDLRIVFDRVRVLRAEFDRPVQVPDAELRCAGHWDPNTDTTIVHQLDCQTPAFHVTRGGDGRSPALLVDPNGTTPFALCLAGRIKDWATLRREYPQVDAIARTINTTLAGSADVSLAFERGHDQDHLQLTLDARSSQWVLNGPAAPYLLADAGLPKRLDLQASRDRQTGRITRPRVSLSIGDLAIAAHNAWIDPLPRPDDQPPATWSTWLTELLSTLQAELTVHTPAIEQVVSLSPALAERIDASRWGGPLVLQAAVTPGERFSDVSVSIHAALESTLNVPGLLVKPTGRLLSLTTHARVPHKLAGRIEGFSLDLAHGDSTLRAGGDDACLEYAFMPLDGPMPALADQPEPARRPIGVDASLRLPLRVEHAEGLVGLLPALDRCFTAHPDSRIAGSFTMLADTRFSLRPGDWLASSEIDLSADALAVRCADLIDKPPGSALALHASHRLQVIAAQREQSITATVRQPGGELNASITFGRTESDGPHQDFEHASLHASLSDLDSFVAIFPRLADRLKPLEFTGHVALDAQSLLIDGRHTLSLSADATGADFVIPGDDPWHKPVGTPARIEMQWQQCPTNPPADGQRYQLTRGRAELAGAQATELTGELVFAQPIVASTLPTMAVGAMAMAAAPQPPLVESATLHAQGGVIFSNALAGLHPQLARWHQQLDLAGQAAWILHARLAPGEVNLRGQLDAEQTHFAVKLGHDLVPRFDKPAGTPASLALDLTIRSPGAAGPSQLDCRELTLELDGNRVTAAGTATLSGEDDSHRPLIEDAMVVADVQLPQLRRLHALLPDSRIASLEGGLTALTSFTTAHNRLVDGLCALDCRDVEVSLGGPALWLDGRITLDERTVQAEQLRWAWGRSNGAISALVQRRDDGRIARGLLGLAFSSLDVADFRECLASLPTNGAPLLSGNPVELTKALAHLVDQLRQADVRVDAHVGTLRTPLPLNVQALADAVVTGATVKDGQLELAFQALAEGGEVAGSMTSILGVEAPTFHLSYKADRIQPGPLVDRYLALTFPGMAAAGPLTLIDESYQKLLPAPDDPNFEAGKGELIIQGGSVQGRAAPLWVTTLFPGLNLTTFDFSFMHSWFDKYPIGRIRHQMIFQGRFYNIYMVGHTDADRHMRYEVGLDFLAEFDSHYWAESGQGRIPLFTKTGLIQPDGTLTDEIVEYRPRRLIESVLLGNNPLVTAYHAVRKRVLGQE